MRRDESYFIFLRYILLLVIGVFGFNLIYYIFTPLTSYPSFFLINLLYPESTLNAINEITIGQEKILLVEACIAGAAYYFLLVLAITTPINVAKRCKVLLFLFTSFLLINILRIALFSYLYIEGFKWFDVAHMATWYVGSTIMLVAIWFLAVYRFKIKDVPVYSDFRYLIKQTKKKRL